MRKWPRPLNAQPTQSDNQGRNERRPGIVGWGPRPLAPLAATGFLLSHRMQGTDPGASRSPTSRRGLAGHIRNHEGITRMRMSGIGFIAAAMLAGSMGMAVAQTSTTTTSPRTASPAAGKCWDSVTKQVRNETPSTGSSSGMSSTSTPTGSSSSTGSTPSSTKPPEAAGLPDCKH